MTNPKIIRTPRWIRLQPSLINKGSGILQGMQSTPRALLSLFSISWLERRKVIIGEYPGEDFFADVRAKLQRWFHFDHICLDGRLQMGRSGVTLSISILSRDIFDRLGWDPSSSFIIKVSNLYTMPLRWWSSYPRLPSNFLGEIVLEISLIDWDGIHLLVL